MQVSWYDLARPCDVLFSHSFAYDVIVELELDLVCVWFRGHKN